jgi:adenine deaminase
MDLHKARLTHYDEMLAAARGDTLIDEIVADARAFRQAIAALDLDPSSPIMPFAIFSLPDAPGAKVTHGGIWDPEKRTLVPLFPDKRSEEESPRA